VLVGYLQATAAEVVNPAAVACNLGPKRYYSGEQKSGESRRIWLNLSLSRYRWLQKLTYKIKASPGRINE